MPFLPLGLFIFLLYLYLTCLYVSLLTNSISALFFKEKLFHFWCRKFSYISSFYHKDERVLLVSFLFTKYPTKKVCLYDTKLSKEKKRETLRLDAS